MNKIYLVKYCGGGHDNYYETIVFATNKKSTATKYVTKFNKILKKWKKHYKQYETKIDGLFSWIADEHIEKHFLRWNALRNIGKCYWIEIEIR